MTDPTSKIPQHIAIIMDGNGRWAEARGLTRLDGHRAGTENLRQIIDGCIEKGVQHLTVYAFSTENWRRPKEEVDGLLNILETYLDRELDALCRKGVRLHHIGRLEAMPEPIREKVKHSIDVTCANTSLWLHLAWNYGGRDEIVYAIQQMLKENIPPDQVNEDLVSQYLFTAGTPDPDLIIRTSGEMRISNFLIWQSAYSEWYFTLTLWPDFSKEELFKAIDAYSQRDRRFGSISSSDHES